MKVRFKGRFTSYSPAIREGFIDSTTLHSALLSATRLLGHEVSGDSLIVSSLLPVLECEDKSKGLLPPLRLPGSNKIRGYWSPKAAYEIFHRISELKANRSKLILIKSNDGMKSSCLESEMKATSISVRINNDEEVNLLYNSRNSIIFRHDEELCAQHFHPPKVMRHHRLSIDRLTQAATPIMYSVVFAPRQLYWAVGLTNDCSVVESAVSMLTRLGIGASRSSGHGSIIESEFACGNEAAKQITTLLDGLDISEADSVRGILLGMFKPAKGSISRAFGEVWEFGSLRGYGGFILPFRRPLVKVLAPGSILIDDSYSKGLVYEDMSGVVVYSFHTLVVGDLAG